MTQASRPHDETIAELLRADPGFADEYLAESLAAIDEPGGQEVEVLLCQEMDHARAQSHDTTTAESPASRARTTLRAGGLPGTQRRPDVPCISDNTPSAGSRRRVGFRIRCMRRLAQSSPRPGG